jgi:hypothetical protein
LTAHPVAGIFIIYPVAGILITHPVAGILTTYPVAGIFITRFVWQGTRGLWCTSRTLRGSYGPGTSWSRRYRNTLYPHPVCYTTMIIYVFPC